MVTACVLLVSLPSLWVYYHYSKQNFLDSTLLQIQSKTSTTIENYQRFIQLASPNLKALSHLLRNELDKPTSKNSHTFKQRMMQFEDGAWRNRSSEFNGYEQAGLFLPSDIVLTAEQKHFYQIALEVFDGFGTSATSNRVLDNIWMMDHQRGKLIFDVAHPDFVYLMPDDTDYLSTPRMTLASPDSNPNRIIKWTPALYDPISESWMISVIYPFDITNEWQATLGINISLDKVFSLLDSDSDKYQGERHFLIDKQGMFIQAGPWQHQFESELPDETVSKLAGLTLDKNIETLESIHVDGIEYQVIASKIEPMGWTCFRLIPTKEIYLPLQNKILNTSLLIIIMTALLGLLITVMVRKIIVSPLLQVAEQARLYAVGDKPLEISLPGDDEVSELNDAFLSMHTKLTADSQQLLQSELRYRHVVSNINETIFQIDQQHRWQFLSPVWKQLSAYDLEYSLHRAVDEFFHLADREYINRILDLLLNDEQASWSGELRLKRLDHRYVWVKLSLHISTDEAEKIINGTIENVHINHITRATNQLIRTAEQMVLSSNCSVITILEFLTKELIDITDIPLVWVKICKDNQGQILSHAGELADFLFEDKKTWSGLHSQDSPVIACVNEHSLVRVTNESELSKEWEQRLENDGINDSLFVPFYLAGGETHAVIGFHTGIVNTFDSDFQQLITDFSSGLRLICQMAEEQNLMRLHRAAVEKTANAIMITNYQGKIEWVNDAFSKQTLFLSEDVIGHKPTLLNSNTINSNQQVKEMWAMIRVGNVWTGEIVNRKKDGTLITVYQTVTPLRDDVGGISHYVSVSEDITERKENQQRIAFMATHDELTSLPNRNLLNDRLQQSIAHAKRQQSKMAVLFIDIDHFKYINDSLGHQIGDELLQSLVQRLTSIILREEDTVARFGGDEFVIVLPNVNELSYVKDLTSSLLNTIKSPYDIQGHELMVTGSIGISIYPDDASNADELIQNADAAMYLAKEQGRNNSQFYTAKINERITRRVNLEKALRQAVELKQFVLRYQPKVDLMTQKITGVEALIRWQHPELGLVSPLEFIPLAEETGVILEIGDWVMLTACQQMSEWELHYSELQNMSINVSARQFRQEDFLGRVQAILAKTAVSINKIEFELTESVVMNDVDSAISTMEDLKQLGLTLSIDDFGTGYSSLSYLQRFPVDVLKIDRAFIDDITSENDDSAIICSILALAKNFNLRVVAEGVEEKYQQTALTSLGCHYGQGYYFSRPVSAVEMTQLLDAEYSD